MITKVTGFILNTVDYKDTSLIINLYTIEYGLIGVMGRCVKSIKNRLRTSTQKFTYGYFYIYYKEGKLSTLKDVDIINPFIHLHENIFLIGYLSYLTELFHQVYKESNEQTLFHIFINILLKMEEGLDPEVLVNIFELKCLSYLGVGIFLDGCIHCGATKDIVTISLDAGGLICRNCYHNEPLLLIKTLNLLRYFNYIDIKSIKKITIKEENKKEINLFLKDYYSKYTGMYLKSKEFINRLKKDFS